MIPLIANPTELVEAMPLHLLSQTALPLKSPTGAFIASQTRSCRKVQDGDDLFPIKNFTAPQHTRPILPLTSSDKIIAALRGRYFSFGELYLESYISRLNEILRHDLTLSVGEPDNAAAKSLIARRAFLSVNSAQIKLSA